MERIAEPPLVGIRALDAHRRLTRRLPSAPVGSHPGSVHIRPIRRMPWGNGEVDGARMRPQGSREIRTGGPARVRATLESPGSRVLGSEIDDVIRRPLDGVLRLDAVELEAMRRTKPRNGVILDYRVGRSENGHECGRGLCMLAWMIDASVTRLALAPCCVANQGNVMRGKNGAMRERFEMHTRQHAKSQERARDLPLRCHGKELLRRQKARVNRKPATKQQGRALVSLIADLHGATDAPELARNGNWTYKRELWDGDVNAPFTDDGVPILGNVNGPLRRDHTQAPIAGEKFRWTSPDLDAVCETHPAGRYQSQYGRGTPLRYVPNPCHLPKKGNPYSSMSKME